MGTRRRSRRQPDCQRTEKTQNCGGAPMARCAAGAGCPCPRRRCECTHRWAAWLAGVPPPRCQVADVAPRAPPPHAPRGCGAAAPSAWPAAALPRQRGRWRRRRRGGGPGGPRAPPTRGRPAPAGGGGPGGGGPLRLGRACSVVAQRPPGLGRDNDVQGPGRGAAPSVTACRGLLLRHTCRRAAVWMSRSCTLVSAPCSACSPSAAWPPRRAP